MKKKTKIHINPIRIKTIILSITIAIVLSAFVIYLVQSIYPSPEYEDFCSERKAIPLEKDAEMTQELCEANNGEWISQDIRCITAPCPQGYCDYYSECQEQYDNARDQYKLIVFIIALITGLIALSIGIMLNLASVSSGLMLGGAFLVFYGTAVYWSNLTNWLRTILLGITLGILIWMGYKKLGH